MRFQINTIKITTIYERMEKLKPLSVTDNRVGTRSAAASHVGHNSSVHNSLSGRSRTDAVICN